MNSLKHRHHHIYLNTQARAVIFSGGHPFFLSITANPSSSKLEFPLTSAPAYTDASTAGGGCCWKNDWL